MKTYLEDLKNALQKMHISEDKIKDILSDMEEMISSAKEEGISDEDIQKKFGDPTKLAKELSLFEQKINEPEEEFEDDTHYAFEPTGHKLSIKIKLISDDVEFRIVESKQIKVIIKDHKNSDKYSVTYENQTLSIEKNHKMSTFFGFSFGSSSAEIIIEIPKDLSIDELKHDVVNGDLKLSQFEVEVFRFNSTEGDIDLDHIKFKEGHIHTVNGDVKMTHSSGVILNFSTVSGDVDFEDSIIDSDLTINTVSGDFEARDSEASTLYFHTVSGDASGKEFYIKKLYFDSISGDIEIKNERKEHIEVMKKKSLSGDINI